jgi:hypothetical protein
MMTPRARSAARLWSGLASLWAGLRALAGDDAERRKWSGVNRCC